MAVVQSTPLEGVELGVGVGDALGVGDAVALGVGDGLGDGEERVGRQTASACFRDELASARSLLSFRCAAVTAACSAPRFPDAPDFAAVAVDVDVLLLLEAWAAWSEASCACALASVASAEFTAEEREVVFRLASVSPLVTFWPTVTDTVSTCPEIGKLTFAILDGVMVPTTSSV
jgi:hypothetical protein